MKNFHPALFIIPLPFLLLSAFFLFMAFRSSSSSSPLRNVTGVTSFLIEAAKDSNITPEKIQTLIKSGADVKAAGEHKHTALINAAMFAGPEVLKILIDAGSDVNVACTTGDTALNMAASYNSNPEVTKILLAAGADINHRDYRGATPLMQAAGKYGKNKEVLKILIDAGSDIFAKDKDGHTALHYAKDDDARKIILDAVK